MTSEEAKDFKEKLDEIAATLIYLNDKYNLQYVLNCLKIENNQYTVNDVFFNPEIGITELEYINYQVIQLQKGLNYLPSLMGSGRTVLTCIDDTQQPKDFVGDWPQKGKTYVVAIVWVIDKKVYFELEQMKSNSKGFSASRFLHIFPSHQLN